MPVTALRPNDPQSLGPYRLVGRLGRGGMGTVYLGSDGSGRKVAVKVVNPELADDPAFHQRFRREVTAARQVRRFCTAPVLDARLDGEPLYVVTEYVDGPTLDQAVRERGAMHGGDLEGLAVNIATALRAVHAAGIVHRDLKPSNVLLSPTGPRVIDFGIARALDAVDGPTRTGQFVGTPAYMAPELMRGGEVTQAADVFAWGCVIAYAGTARSPFAGATVPEIINRVTNDPPVLDGLDPALRDLVVQALSKDPTARPSTDELLRRLTGEHQAPPTALADVVASPPRDRTNRWMIPAGAAALVAVVAIVAAVFIPSLTDRKEGTDAGTQTGPSGTPEPLNTTFDFNGPPPKPKRVVFSDNFDNQNSGWKVGEGLSYQQGAYRMTNRLTTVSPVPHGRSDSLSPQFLDVQAFTDSMVESGLYCFHNGQSGLLFTLSSQDGRVSISALQGGSGTRLRTRIITGILGGYNRMQAACAWTRKGTGQPRVQAGLWIDGKPVLQTEVPTESYAIGTSGIALVPLDGGTYTALFDEFSISTF